MGDYSPRMQSGGRLPWWVWVGGAAAAGAAGLAWAWSPLVATGAILAVGIGSLILLSGAFAGVAFGLYWLAFSLYQTVFLDAGIESSGIFYPFYAWFVLNFFFQFFRNRLVANWQIVLPYALFLLVIVYSFVGFARPLDFFVVQRVLATILGLLLLFQITSRRELVPVISAAVVASTLVSIWVIVSAAKAGFSYRGDIEADQNFAAFVVGLGVVSAVALLASRRQAQLGRLTSITLTVCLAGMLYGSLLLASRGMMIALAIALTVTMLRLIMTDRSSLIQVMVIILLSAAGVLLPGGDGLLRRFDEQTTASGGSRVPLWIHTLDEYSESGPAGLLLGNGFKSSEAIIESQFGIMTSVHNAYIQMLYELGIVGLGVFVVLHGAVAAAAWRSRDAFGLISLGIISFLLGSNLTADSTDGFLYWTAFGGAAALATWSSMSHRHSRDTLSASVA